MPNKLTILGTGTNQLELHRMASSVLIQLGKLNILYDMGRGISQRLVELKLKQDDIEHIIISHFHPDHISDIIPYIQAAICSGIDPRTKELNFYGPKGLKSILTKLLDIASSSWQKQTYKINIHEITNQKIIIQDKEFISQPLPPVENHGLKFTHHGKTIAITGDSYFHQNEINFLKYTDIAIIDSGHISDEEIVQLAQDTQVKQIYCSHQYRDIDSKIINNKAKENGYTGKIIVAKDLMKILL